MSKSKFPKINMFATIANKDVITVELLQDNALPFKEVVTLPEYIHDTIIVEIFAAGYSKEHTHVALLPSRKHLEIELTIDDDKSDNRYYFTRVQGHSVYYGKVHLLEATSSGHSRVIELPFAVRDDYTAVRREDGVTMVVLRRREDLSGAERIQFEIDDESELEG